MEELLVRCFLIGRRNNNTSLFIIISHCFTVKLSNQLTFWPKKNSNRRFEQSPSLHLSYKLAAWLRFCFCLLDSQY